MPANNQPPSPPEDFEEEKEESVYQANPHPFIERLTYPLEHTLEETELLGELKNMCVKIPLLQAIEDVPIYKMLIKDKCLKHSGLNVINVINRNKHIPLMSLDNNLT